MSEDIKNCMCNTQCHYDCTRDNCECPHHVRNFVRPTNEETFPEFWDGFGRRMLDADVDARTIAQCAWHAAKAQLPV